MKRAFSLILVLFTLFTYNLTFNTNALESKYQHSKSYTEGPYYARLKEINLSNDSATNIVNIAKSQVGYHEGASSSDLSGVSTGKKDYCEYNYNIQKGSNLAWCSTFVSWCATQAGESAAVSASGSSDDIYFHVLAAGGKKLTPSEVRAGDLVFYRVNSTGRLCHCGIMTDNSTSIEGNYSDTVKICTPSKYIGTAGMTVENGKISVIYLRPNYTNNNLFLPKNPTISIKNTTAIINQKLTIDFDASSATYFSVSIKNKETGEIVLRYNSASSGSVYFTPKNTGEYEATLKASNSNGSVEDSIEFTVELYSDISQNSFFYSAVKWASSNGVTYGTSNETFSPNKICSRAQAVTMLWRAAGSPPPSSTVTLFADVEPDKYYFEAVQWAVEQGITNGVNTLEFAPESACSRAHIITFIYRMCSSPSVNFKQIFNDVKSNSYYSSAVTWAVQQKITNGTSNVTFSPNDLCTRAQMVTFLYRYYNK